jgi:hypothetical protein
MQQTLGKRARSDSSVLKLIPLWAFSLRPLPQVISSDSGISSNTEHSWPITGMDLEIFDVDCIVHFKGWTNISVIFEKMNANILSSQYCSYVFENADTWEKSEIKLIRSEIHPAVGLLAEATRMI